MPSMRQLIVFSCCLGLPLAQAAEPVPLGGRPIVTLQRSGGAPVRLTLSDLEALPSETLEAQLPGEANARWQGVRLSLLLRHLDLAPPKRLRVLALNDYSAIIRTATSTATSPSSPIAATAPTWRSANADRFSSSTRWPAILS